MTFLEDLQRSEARAAQLQVMLADEKRIYVALIGEKKTVEQELGKTRDELAKALDDVESRDRTISDLRSVGERVALLEQAAGDERDRANSLDRELASVAAAVGNAERRAAVAEAALEDTKVEFAERLKESEHATALLDAFRARAEADAVIANHV